MFETLDRLWSENHSLILIVVFMAGVFAVIELFKLLVGPSRRKPYRQIGRTDTDSKSIVMEGSSGVPLKDTPAGKLGASIKKGVCPDCGSKEGFYLGPQGAISTNVFCANPKCCSGFNYTNMFHEGHAERIQNGRDELYK
jgi:hypothetical protein